MFYRKTFLAVLLASACVLNSAPLFAACSVQEYSDRMQTLQTEMLYLQQHNPQKYQEVMQEVQKVGEKIDPTNLPTDFGPLCALLDEMLQVLA